MLAKAVASESEVNFISVRGPELLSKWVGEVFRKARQAAPCILFFDELDSLAPVRSAGGGDSHVTDRVISQFLAELDGLEELKGVVILAATNRLDIIDPALLRAGRFDFLLRLPIPDEKARAEIFKVHTRGKPLANGVDIEALAQATERLVGSDIESICGEASMLAIRECIETQKEKEGGDYSDFEIKARHFTEAIELVRRPERE